MSNITVKPDLVKKVKQIGQFKNSAAAIEGALKYYIKQNSSPKIKGFDLKVRR